MIQETSVIQRFLKSKRRTIFTLVGFMVLLGLVVIPVLGAQPRTEIDPSLSSRLSQSVLVRFWMQHPDQAPPQFQERFQNLSTLKDSIEPGALSREAEVTDDVFNQDIFGLPQNEEAVTLCPSLENVVLGGTNDYRGLIDPEFNLTGWHLSLDSGESLANEGLLPPVNVRGTAIPSGGDPVVADGTGCKLYASSLNYDPFDPFGQTNAIGVYSSDPDRLAACPGGSDPSCWPRRRAVAVSQPSHFLDKEWFDVGVSGAAGEVVWVTYSDFVIDFEAPLGFTSASIQAVRCSADLRQCTRPILISGEDLDVQFSDVTIGPDGQVYVTWAEIIGELEFTPQTFIIKMRVAPAGSTEFGPTRIVHEEELPIPFGGFLHANDFRVATYPKHEVVTINGQPRVFVIWDACTARPLGSVCEEPVIKLKYSDDLGSSWSDVTILSVEGDNYFPTIGTDGENRLVAAWFTNRFDPDFHNRQDVEFISLDATSLDTSGPQRLTEPSNETEADPLLGGFFIGDYIEVAARPGTAFVHFNANYRQIELLFEGFPIPQQDNFLTRVELGE